MAEWVKPEREKKRGVEPKPIEAPNFTPVSVPEKVATPEREVVPVRQR